MATYAKHEIAMALRELLEAWGIESKATTPEDAFADLAKTPPFGVKTEMVEIVPEQSVTADEVYETDCSKEFEDGTFEATFENGKNYTVVINDEAYKCMAHIENMGKDCLVVGNTDMPKEMPFHFVCMETQGGLDVAFAWKADLGETITLAIYEEQEVVQQIDPKFVGASGGGAVVVTFNTTDGQNFTADKTLDELLETVKNGVNVVAKLPDNEYSNIYLNISKAVFEGDISPKQMEFTYFQVVGSGNVTFYNLNYHSTNGITVNMSSYTPQ